MPEELIKWMLKWCNSYDWGDGHHLHGTELFDDKEDLLYCLEELQWSYGDALEYQWGQAKQIMMPKWMFLSDLQTKDDIKIPENLFKETPKVQRQPRIEDFVKEES